MLSTAWQAVRASAETLRQYRAAMVTAEALIWHHGYKGLDEALKAAENPTGGLAEIMRAELVARIAADRYLRFKDADLVERAALLERWSRCVARWIRMRRQRPRRRQPPSERDVWVRRATCTLAHLGSRGSAYFRSLGQTFDQARPTPSISTEQMHPEWQAAFSRRTASAVAAASVGKGPTGDPPAQCIHQSP